MSTASQRPIQPAMRGPFTIALEVLIGLLMMSGFSIFLGTLIEITGSYTNALWKEEGLGHAQRIVAQDLAYIEQAPRSILVRDTVGFANDLVRWVRLPYERLGLLHWYQHTRQGQTSQSQAAKPSSLMPRASCKAPHRERAFLRSGLERAAGTLGRALSQAVVTSMYVTQDVLLRLAIAVFALPAFALACLVGIVDGLVRRDLRRWSGGRESSFVYHHAKNYTRWALTAGFGFYLTWPFGGINPTWMVLVFTVLVAFTLSVTVSRFKKYA